MLPSELSSSALRRAHHAVETEELEAPRALAHQTRVQQRRAVQLVEHVQAVVQALDRQALRAEARRLERVHRRLHLLHPPASKSHAAHEHVSVQ